MARPAPAPSPIARLVLLLGSAAVAACSSGGGAAERQADRGPAVPVRAATVVQKEAPVVVPAIGRVQAYSTVEVRSQVVRDRGLGLLDWRNRRSALEHAAAKPADCIAH